MHIITLVLVVLIITVSCNNKENNGGEIPQKGEPVYGGDFSIMKKLEDAGGNYKIDGEIKDGFQIFKENNYTWSRLRIFHSPNMEGPVCNNLDYTIALAKEAKSYGFKFLLNFHYSDTWADPAKQFVPEAWENLDFETLTDSVYQYTKKVVNALADAGAAPDMVQVGNEINNGMIWPQGRLWNNDGTANWDELAALLKAGIRGVKNAENGAGIPILIHAATGGNVEESDNFYSNIIERGVEFDVIGLSYYPWWHGTFDDLENNLAFLSNKYEQEISVVETAYYANGWYPEPAEWVLDVQPFPPTEQGQYDFLVKLDSILKEYPKVTSVYYWKPDGMEVPGTGVPYLGRSLFSRDGNAFKGISAWKEDK
ncbi:MAG: glycoside hydrolase family 53 protein [Tangfeifania sp.]